MPRAKAPRRRPAPPDPALLRAVAPSVGAQLGPAAVAPAPRASDAPLPVPEPAKLVLARDRGDQATGMQAPEAQVFALSALIGVLQPTKENIATKMDVAVEVMGEIAPTNALEALLASQMIATHHVAMHMLERALYRDQPSEAIDRMVTPAVRLQRLFADQLNALGKLRGQGSEQRLTVVHEHRHVHVHADATHPAGVNPHPPGGGGEVPALAPGAYGGEGTADGGA